MFKEFEEVSSKAWKQQIQFDLNGKDYNQNVNWVSNEGITVRPFYNSDEKVREDIYVPDEWNISQYIEIKNEYESNRLLISLINKEVYDFTIKFQNDVCDLEILFDKIKLEYINLYIQIDSLDSSLLLQLNDFSKKNKCNLHLDIDIFGRFAQTGNWMLSKKEDEANFQKLLDNLSEFKSIIQLKSSIFQNSGANIIQEVAYTMMLGDLYISTFGEKIIPKINFEIAIGSNYFFEIAKLQSYRVLWKTITSYYNKPINNLHIISIPSKRNKTIYEYNSNIVRTTTENMAAILGGVNSIKNFNYDNLFKKENNFSNRISINQLLILKHEASISKVKNPVSGSYYISYLIDEISNQSYDLFKELDGNGNLIDHLYTGLIQKKIKENAIKEQDNFDNSKEIIVGANKFNNNSEKIKSQCDIDPFLSRNTKTLIEPLSKRRLASKIENNKFLNE